MDQSPLDPDVVRRRTLAALDCLPFAAQLAALTALEHGDVTFDLCPFTGGLIIWIGDLDPLVLERSELNPSR